MLQGRVESLDGVPEALHEHYVKDGDGYNLRVENYEGDAGLRTVLEDTKAKLKAKRDQLRTYEGIDPEEVAELRELREEYESKIAAAGSWEDQKARLEAKHAKEIEKLTGERDGLGTQLDSVLKKEASRAVLEKQGAIVDALLPHVLDRVKIVTEDGERRAVASGLDGDETDISGLVKQMQDAGEQFAWGFLPGGKSGGGSTTAGGGGSAGRVRSKSDLKSAAEHSDFIAKHGLKAYQELPREVT